MEFEGGQTPLLEARRLSKIYLPRGSWPFSARTRTTAVDGVSLSLQPCARVSLVGQSGSGKSTLARCLSGLEKPDAGTVLLHGCDLASLSQKQLRRARRSVQMVFQHSTMALNPSLTVAQIIAEPLVAGGCSRRQAADRVSQLMDQAGLAWEWHLRRPGELSGGQRQRTAIARALATGPEVLIWDEAFSGLDLPLQAQLIRMLDGIRDSSGVAVLLITHDIRLAAAISDEILVMHRGRIVDWISAGLAERTVHSHTRALIDALPDWPPGACAEWTSRWRHT